MSRIKLLHSLFLNHPIICTDTRKIEKGCIFFALKGPNFNGNKFATDALEKGAAFAIIDEAENLTDDRCLLVDDVLKCLQELASYHRKQFDIPVIAIAGSNGKTTTKELITHVLMQKYKVLATPGNLNNHIGVPLTLLMLTDKHEAAVIEMGANHIGENAFLCDIIDPNLGVITNNGKDHLEGFGSLEGVAKSNSELYYYLLQHNGHAFVNAHDEMLMRMASRLNHKTTYAGNGDGREVQADITAQASQLRPEIIFRLPGYPEEVKSCLSGDYNFDNIMASVCIGLHLDVSEDQIKKGIESYVPSNNRSQIINTQNNTLYLDAYNANPSSMEAALRNFAALKHTHKVAILGDMFELGDYSAKEHQLMIALAKSLPIEQVYFVGEAFSQQASVNEQAFLKTTDALEFFKTHPVHGAQVFLKGSRGMKLESLVEVL